MLRSLLYLFVVLLALPLGANNITVTNVALVNQNAGAGTSTIRFDLSWDNSWRISSGPSNYDAAWVFAKYRVGGGVWRHALLSGVGTPPAGGTVDRYDQTGAMIYRSADGSGDVSFTDVELIWDYQGGGVDENDVIDLQVFAIEMVYVPEGAFFLGTGRPVGGNAGSEEVNEFYTRTIGAFGIELINPYRVTSEAAIDVSTDVGDLYYFNQNSAAGDQTGPIPATFPKGYAAFYSMKYEVTEGQWVAFFNTLTPTQQENLDMTGLDGKNSDEVVVRNTVAWEPGGAATTSAPDRATAFTTVRFLLAYLDWSGLRPLTETEYEKAGRGPTAPVNEEFAWGTTSIYSTNYVMVNDGTPSEAVSNPGQGTGNANYDATDPGGPVRAGIFAASALNANREETGGSYYGIMELSGNLYERLVTVGNPTGRAFTGAHGDGNLLADGNPNVVNWPNAETAEGMSFRGASYINTSRFLRLSDRNDGALALTSANTRLGFRGGRTAQ